MLYFGPFPCAYVWLLLDLLCACKKDDFVIWGEDEKRSTRSQVTRMTGTFGRSLDFPHFTPLQLLACAHCTYHSLRGFKLPIAICLPGRVSANPSPLRRYHDSREGPFSQSQKSSWKTPGAWTRLDSSASPDLRRVLVWGLLSLRLSDPLLYH